MLRNLAAGGWVRLSAAQFIKAHEPRAFMFQQRATGSVGYELQLFENISWEKSECVYIWFNYP